MAAQMVGPRPVQGEVLLKQVAQSQLAGAWKSQAFLRPRVYQPCQPLGLADLGHARLAQLSHSTGQALVHQGMQHLPEATAESCADLSLAAWELGRQQTPE